MSVLSKRTIEFREDFAIAMIITSVFILVAVMVGVGMNLQAINRLNSSYFKSDGMKLVLSMNKDIASFDDSDYEADITHVVYYYTGNTINNVRVFFAYDTKNEARTAYNNISMDGKHWALKKKLQEESNGNNDNAKALADENKKLQEKVEQLTRQLADAKKSASAESSTILDDLDDGIEFTGKGNDDDQEEDKNQMSLF